MRRLLSVPLVRLRCSGCGWRAGANTLDALARASRGHDDSPRTQHIVSLDPPGVWPKDDEAFRALLSASPGGAR